MRKEIYIKADEDIIDEILEMIRGLIGVKVYIVDLNPKLVEEKEEDE